MPQVGKCSSLVYANELDELLRVVEQEAVVVLEDELPDAAAISKKVYMRLYALDRRESAEENRVDK